MFFNQVKHFFKTKTHLPEPTIKERIQMAEKHLKMAIKWKGEKLGVLETRRHYSNYFKGIINQSLYLRDGLHFNDLGYKILVNEVKLALKNII